MGLFSNLFGVGKAVDGVKAVGNILDDLFTSGEEKLTLEQVKIRLLQEPGKAQAHINQIEAGHRSIFVAGWRPFIGWVCGVGLFWAFMGHPLFEWVVAIKGLGIPAPNLETENMMELVLAMLGLGGLRTVEKIKGRTK
jgi:hypothetical protein